MGLSFTHSANDTICSAPVDLSPSAFADHCNYRPQKSKNNYFMLSDKEKECVSYLCQGLTMKMIARQLGISPKTVETYIERAKIKMGCHNKAQLVLLC